MRAAEQSESHGVDIGSMGSNETDISQWRGGDHYWKHEHYDYCFMCENSGDMLLCATCNLACHLDCVPPPSDSSALNSFWFCPVCTGKGWHVPPSLLETMDNLMPLGSRTAGEAA